MSSVVAGPPQHPTELTPPPPAPQLPVRVYRLIEEAKEAGRQDILAWANDGAVFLVKDTKEFCKLLPRYGFVANWPSFHRNLNIHGFQRWVYPVDGT